MPHKASRLRRALLVVGLGLLATAMHVPALAHPQPIDDEAIYAVVANEIVAGGLPYRDGVERKPPLLFYTYATVFKVAGTSNWHALHAFATLWLLATMAGLWVLGRRIFSPSAGVVAAVTYCVFMSWGVWRNLAFNGEMMMNLPIVWAWACMLPRGRHQPHRLFTAGALSCTAFLLKQPAAISAVPLVVYLWLSERSDEEGRWWRSPLAQTIWFGTGGLIVLGAVAAWLWSRGILADAVYWSIGDHDIPHFFWTRALLFTLAFVGSCAPLMAGAGLALSDSELWRSRRAEMSAVLGLLVASGVGAAASGRFYPHYYLQLIPPLALLAGGGYMSLTTGLRAKPGWLPPLRVVFAWTATSAVVFCAVNWYWLSSKRLPSGPGRYVLEHSRSDDRIFVWGESPQVYLDAERRPASRYIATFPLTGYIFGGPLPGVDTRSRILPGAWDTLQRDFAAHPPWFIVDTEIRPGALYPIADFPILAEIVRDQFELVQTTLNGTVYRRRDR